MTSKMSRQHQHHLTSPPFAPAANWSSLAATWGPTFEQFFACRPSEPAIIAQNPEYALVEYFFSSISQPSDLLITNHSKNQLRDNHTYLDPFSSHPLRAIASILTPLIFFTSSSVSFALRAKTRVQTPLATPPPIAASLLLDF